MTSVDTAREELRQAGEALDSSAARLNASAIRKTEIAEWHQAADAWAGIPDRVPEILDDEARLSDWARVGAKQAATAAAIASALGDETLSARFVKFAADMPASLKTVAKATFDTAKSAAETVIEGAGEVAQKAGTTAAWAIALPLLILGAAVALVAFGLKKGGVRLSAGPVAVG